MNIHVWHRGSDWSAQLHDRASLHGIVLQIATEIEPSFVAVTLTLQQHAVPASMQTLGDFTF